MHLNRVSHGPTIVWLVIPLLTALGCAARFPPRLPTEAREQFGTIGVVSARFTPSAAITEPRNTPTYKVIKNSAAGTLIGGGTGAIVGCLAGLACGPWAGICCPVFGLWGLGGGATAGAITGGAATYLSAKSERTPVTKTATNFSRVNEMEANVKKALKTCRLQEVVGDSVLSVGQARSGKSFVRIRDLGPTVTGEEISYRHLKSDGIDTILELTVEEVGWTGKDFDSDLLPVSLYVTARMRLIRVSDDQALSSHIHRYEGEKRSHSEWDDHVFQKEIDEAARWLGERIVEQVSLAATTAENEGWDS